MTTTEPPRPDPDALLNRIEAEAEKSRRGKLKIFFGSSAGVGKTYAMLSAAREQRSAGLDVAIGVIETHKRPETEKLLEGLPVIPPLIIQYKGVKLKELDLDAIKVRRPGILLVDELAHTNAPGVRHPKRWHDVMELLDAGIDVYTTLNVQHIESLSDVVAGSTGVWVKETVPDSLFDAADDIVLVDIDADDLLKRLKEGKVYVAPQVKARAAENFFKKDNLIALRELALRRTAERVDAQMEAYDDSKGVHGRYPVSENLLVCIGPDSLSARVVRTAKRMATALKAPWTALYVENMRHYRLNPRGRRNIESIFRMVERIGGDTVTVQGKNAADTIINYARENKVTKIIVGKPIRSQFKTFFWGSLADKIIQKSGIIDVYIVTEDRLNQKNEEKTLKKPLLDDFNIGSYIWAIVVVALCTALGLASRGVLTEIDQALIYLTGIVIVAAEFGRGPSLFYSVLCVFAFGYFFVSPENALNLQHPSYFITFLVMLMTGYVIAGQASELRLQALFARQKERYTETLYSLTRELASTRGRQKVSETAARHVAAMMDSDVTIWMMGADGDLVSLVGALPEESLFKEMGVLQWCFDNGKVAGRATTTMPSAMGLYFPLIASTGIIGVLGVLPKTAARNYTLDETAQLETLASLVASTLDRVKAGDDAERARVEAEIEKLRNVLMRARDDEP